MSILRNFLLVKFLILIVLLSFAMQYQVFSQNETGKNIFSYFTKEIKDCGKVTIIQDNRIEKLINKHIEQNQKKLNITGYRIQIYSGTGNSARNEARQVQSNFLSLFPEFQVYMIYQEPYFKIRVGDFRSKVEGFKILTKVKTQFPDCYFVIDNNINYPKLKE